ncbi:DUF2304 domain-containing protein [Micromonospora inositola]|uniref:DUF2304 domain-containing protein n=1 Tax=Micromonospora inositola TaxID=47865 RepID=A0A1C5GYG1_9ACTN|nr:DUF2304 domain-containing protein [Micromonospora inositola]SCG38826.1 hypothetical protein GA0070613_0575 [Micromonospora inositola]
MRLTLLTGATGLILLAIVVEMMRRRQLREKYAALWVAVALAALPLAFFPRLPDHLAGLLGVVNGVSLVLFSAVAFLLLITIHLSWELNRLEVKTRVLAEEVALLRAPSAVDGTADDLE